MALVKMMMPKMGESIFECTVLNWLINEGDLVQADDMILEVATDKIDTEVASTQSGIIKEFLVKVGEIAKIGEPICLIETDEVSIEPDLSFIVNQLNFAKSLLVKSPEKTDIQSIINSDETRFYSPLVLSIAKEEQISKTDLEKIVGTGLEGRVTKHDLFEFLKNKSTVKLPLKLEVPIQGNDEIIPMDRVRKMIAERMVESVRIAPHVTSFVETDMTNIVLWRDKNKELFKQKHKENITFTPILIQAVAKAIADFPMMNIQVQGENIIKKANINIGMAVALPNGNLIVPVIKNANLYNLFELSQKVNDLTNRARENKLKPDDLADGTFTISNIGTFGNITGTPIINQPQVGIVAFGAIQKKPAVLETPTGDVIAIRHKMLISHSYDHRVVDGFLGGSVLKRISDYLEAFDLKMEI
jgi:2-oxoglutarate dehydrogenase E2 component (dihydrolipoamide succinyltransferase)